MRAILSVENLSNANIGKWKMMESGE